MIYLLCCRAPNEAAMGQRHTSASHHAVPSADVLVCLFLTLFCAGSAEIMVGSVALFPCNSARVTPWRCCPAADRV